MGMKWLGLGAGRRELKELEKTSIDKRIFIQIRVCMWEGKVRTGSLQVTLVCLLQSNICSSILMVHDVHSV